MANRPGTAALEDPLKAMELDELEAQESYLLEVVRSQRASIDDLKLRHRRASRLLRATQQEQARRVLHVDAGEGV